MDATLERALTWVLAIALVLSLGGVVAIAVNPPDTSPPFTEMYVLGPDGNASGYPTALAPGETGTVIVGISNHEDREVSYDLLVTWNGTVTQTRTVTVADGATRELRLTLTAPPREGEYRVRFLLFKGDPGGEPYRYLRLFVDVGLNRTTTR
ncbi:MAG: DUF1616 domain-containing protein [Halobacteriaceae archaeon]